MNNKITKKRLSDMIAYDWIRIIITVVISILLFEFLFSTTRPTLTGGQSFNLIYYKGLNPNGAKNVNRVLGDDIFSYDVRECNVLQILNENEYDQMTTMFMGNSIDVLAIDKGLTYNEVDHPEGSLDAEKYAYSNFKDIIDTFGHYAYDYDALLSDAKTYIASLSTDGELDDDKIAENFRKRKKNDKRFYVFGKERKNFDEGIKKEKQRLVKLKAEVEKFEKLVNLDDLFVEYTKFEYTAFALEREQEAYAQETSKKYGLDLGKLEKGANKTDVSNLFRRVLGTSAEDVVLIVYRDTEANVDLQFETILFINRIIEKCSDIYDIA